MPKGINLTISDSRGPEVLAFVDFIATSHSTVAYEGLYYGTPCLSLQIGTSVPLENITDRLDLSTLILSTRDLDTFLHDIDFVSERKKLLALKRQYVAKKVFFSDGKATTRVIHEIKNMCN